MDRTGERSAMIEKIAVAISGGVDSMMAAHLLKAEGHEVFGVHFVTGYEPDKIPEALLGEIITPHDKKALHPALGKLADTLNIPIHILDFRAVFREKVVDYFVHTYLAGKTPNPCLYCNPAIKFGTLLTYAMEKGADKVATGHYARIEPSSGSRYLLKKGTDPVKDQSYFLAFSTQDQLERLVLPLGTYTKKEIVELAAHHGLSPSTQKESQDICFIPDGDYQRFIERQPEFSRKPGPIVDVKGNVVGEHQGLHLFTVGQRRGINCPAKNPYYVGGIDVPTNTLFVGFREELATTACRVSQVNWITSPPPSAGRTHVKLRYRHREIPCTIHAHTSDSVLVNFHTPVFPVTPGQGAIFILDDVILGGGIISRERKERTPYADL